MQSGFQQAEAARFHAAIRKIDEANSRDPNVEMVDGKPRPKELVYSEWLTDWVLRLKPNASEALRLAARCQHICRWEIARDSYPMDRAGYLRWRADLKRFHADFSGRTLREVGYEETTVTRVQELNLKKGFPADADTRVLEDALCLVFLERQFAALAAKTSDEKMVTALKKSWDKMTEPARALALKLDYGANERRLLRMALGQD